MGHRDSSRVTLLLLRTTVTSPYIPIQFPYLMQMLTVTDSCLLLTFVKSLMHWLLSVHLFNMIVLLNFPLCVVSAEWDSQTRGGNPGKHNQFPQVDMQYFSSQSHILQPTRHPITSGALVDWSQDHPSVITLGAGIFIPSATLATFVVMTSSVCQAEATTGTDPWIHPHSLNLPNQPLLCCHIQCKGCNVDLPAPSNLTLTMD